MSPDSFLARALLASDMLTRPQLEVALKWLEEAPQGGLGDLLCTNGVFPRAMYELLKRFYTQDNSRESAPAMRHRDRAIQEAQLYCLICHREKKVPVEQLRESVDHWVRLEKMGRPRPIGEVMIEKGCFDQVQQRAISEMTKESGLKCSSCGEADLLYKVYGIPFSCDQCKAPLVPARTRGGVPSPKDELTGLVLGGCRVEEKLGQGRRSAVFKGVISTLNRPAALKIFAGETPQGAIRRCVENARKAVSLSHSGLVPVMDAGIHDGRGWILMENVTDAKIWPAREKMGWNRLCKVGIELSRALEVIHSSGLVHGDVRPSSVFVRDNGAMLSDFGQAHDGTLATPCDPLVAAPELWKGQPPDSKTDLYALGVTLYCFATGQPPFEPAAPLLLGMAHRSTAPKSPGSLNLELPRALSAIIMKLLEKDGANRYGSAGQVARDIHAVLRGDAPAAADNIAAVRPMPGEGDRLLLEDEFPCPNCDQPIDATTVECKCGHLPCV